MDVERTTPEILPVFKALADESRLRIIGLLANREHSVEELATTLRLKAATVSHHLATLRGVDLVAMRAEGTTHVYRFQPEALRRLNRELAPERLRSIPQDLDGDAWERKVLGDFLVEGRLPALPVNARKRMVVLRWLAGKFAFGRVYPELEVNAIIAEHHNDYASVRRYFVDEGFMSRAAGLYRRLEREG